MIPDGEVFPRFVMGHVACVLTVGLIDRIARACPQPLHGISFCYMKAWRDWHFVKRIGQV